MDTAKFKQNFSVSFVDLSMMYVILLAINIQSALHSHIDDTDETYGYWEPLHYLLYGSGMQTWEYSPQYAIRSYAFIFPLFAVLNTINHITAIFGSYTPLNLVLGVGQPEVFDKIWLFYMGKVVLGIFSSWAAIRFIRAIREKFHDQTYLYVFIFLAFSSGKTSIDSRLKLTLIVRKVDSPVDSYFDAVLRDSIRKCGISTISSRDEHDHVINVSFSS